MDNASYGKRLMPSVLQDEAAKNPDRVFAKIPNSTELSAGFRSVTFGEVNQAVDFIAHLLVSSFGEPQQPGQSLAFFGVPDIRYNIVFYACVKCRFKVLLPSPRNPASTNISLMQQTQCSIIVHSPEVKQVTDTLRDLDPNVKCLQIKPTAELLQVQSPPFPYNRTFIDVRDEPILVLHSSGSTGVPRPITMTHGTFATVDNDRNFPAIPGRTNHDLTIWDFDESEAQIYEPFPPFHLAGFMNKIMVPIWTKTVPVFGPANRPPSGALAAQILRIEKIRGAVLPPIVAEQLYHEPGGFELLKDLDVLCFAGGPLAQKVGDELAKHTVLCQFYGSTEVGQVRQLVPRQEDWSYIEFHPALKFEMLPVDDAFELVVLCDASTADFSAFNHNFPELDRWHTKDLFRPHPTKHNLWRFHARRDDIIVLSNGEKINPIAFEGHVSAAASVSGALLLGQGRPYPLLLVELNSDVALDRVALEGLWPTVEEANRLMPTCGRIARSAVLFADKMRPLPRAGKGTIIRSQASTLYHAEINSAYHTKHLSITNICSELKSEPTGYASPDVRNIVRSLIKYTASEVVVGDGDDLYLHGLDSRSTMEITRLLYNVVKKQKPNSDASWISIDLFYNNPSIADISDIIVGFLNNDKKPQRRDRAGEMRAMIHRFTETLVGKDLVPPPETPPSLGRCVAVTGTTGYVGRWILKLLLECPEVSSVYCLNRSDRAEQVWHEATEDWSIAKRSSKKPIFLQINFSSPDLGLPADILDKIVDECDLILHNAWTVNFNLALRSFNENIQGVRSLIDVSLKSFRKPRIVFISSIAATGVWSNSSEESLFVPESHVSNFEQAVATGYGESKMVAEQILYTAHQTASLPMTVLRVGQVAPPSCNSQGRYQWPDRDAVPTLLRASKQIGMVPSDLSDIDWIPVDHLASIVRDVVVASLAMASGGQQQTCQYYNLVNPHRLPWREMMPVVRRWCGHAVAPIPFSIWLQQLRTHVADARSGAQPAGSLLHFFELMEARGKWAEWATDALTSVSESFNDLEPVSVDMMQKWLHDLLAEV